MTDKMIAPKAKKAKVKNVRILFVLDRSGSMSSIKEETIGGFNAFIAEQKSIPGKALLSLVQFDNQYLVVHDNVPLQDVPDLDGKTFVPRGMTALYDAIGITINHYKEEKVPKTKTILAILTDGGENSSKEYSHAMAQGMIEAVQNELGWDVLFIGANIDAKAVGGSLGIKASNTASFDYTSKGAGDAISAMSFATSSIRGMSNYYADGTLADANNLDMTKMYESVKMNLMKKDVDITS
jgi:uncharacterized protein YegL